MLVGHDSWYHAAYEADIHHKKTQKPVAQETIVTLGFLVIIRLLLLEV